MAEAEEISRKAQQRGETSRRQRDIARLWFKGLTKEEIAIVEGKQNADKPVLVSPTAQANGTGESS